MSGPVRMLVINYSRVLWAVRARWLACRIGKAEALTGASEVTGASTADGVPFRYPPG